jgi:hypothetical protein
MMLRYRVAIPQASRFGDVIDGRSLIRLGFDGNDNSPIVARIEKIG